MALLLFFGQGEEELEQAGKVFLDVSDDDMFHLGLTAHLFHDGIGEAQGHHDFGSRIVELVFQLPSHVLGIAGHDDTTSHEGSIVGDDELGAVDQMDGHPITLFDAQSLQRSGESLGMFQELPVGHRGIHEGVPQGFYHVAKDQRRLAGILFGGVQQELVQGNLGIVDGGRHSRVILAEPRFLHYLLLCHAAVVCRSTGTGRRLGAQ